LAVKEFFIHKAMKEKFVKEKQMTNKYKNAVSLSKPRNRNEMGLGQ
jgi:hypothetical protein